MKTGMYRMNHYWKSAFIIHSYIVEVFNVKKGRVYLNVLTDHKENKIDNPVVEIYKIEEAKKILKPLTKLEQALK